MVAHLGVDSEYQGCGTLCAVAALSFSVAKLHFLDSCSLCRYDAIIDLTRSLNSRYCNPAETQQATQQILRSLFPAWLLPAFRAMFSRPLPTASCRLNAWVTALTCQWLMGPCKVNDVELADGTIGKAQGVLIERCRYLEQSGCASICINSCKVPTQVHGFAYYSLRCISLLLAAEFVMWYAVMLHSCMETPSLALLLHSLFKCRRFSLRTWPCRSA